MKRFLFEIEIRNPPTILTILGPSGRGKTHLMQMAVKAARYLGADPSYMLSWEKTKDYHHHDSFMHSIDKAKMVAIDDLRPIIENQGHISFMREALSACLKRFTLVSSNMSFEEIDALDPAISSRLKRQDGKIITLNPAIPDYSDVTS